MSDNLQYALNELRLTMGKMETALDLIDEAIVWVNDACEIEWCNGVFSEITQRSHIELIGASLPAVAELKELGTPVPHKSHPAMRTLEGQETLRGYYQIGKEDLPIELVARPLLLPGQPNGAILTIRDVSKIQKLEQFRLQSLALQATAEAVAITDASGTVEWINRAFTELTGYSAETIYGRNLKILKSGKTKECTYNEMWKAINAGKTWSGELTNKRSDGRIYTEEQSITPVHDRSGAIIHYIAVKRDITQRKAADLEIKKLSSVATRTDNAVIITNASGEIEWVNTAFTTMTEYSLAEVIGRRPGSLLQGPETDNKTTRKMSACLKNKKGFNVEIINYSKSGKKYWVSIEVRPLYDNNEELINFLAIQNDITERKKSEEMLAATRRHEIDIASRIQRTLLLGREQERINGAQLAALSVPSQQVDGDFFDCLVHSEDCMDIVLGDVMGKGIPAALLGGAAKSAILRSISSIISSSQGHHLPHPCEIIMSLHAALARELIELDSFITLFYGRICDKKRILRYVDCGHTQSIHYRKTDQSCHLFSGNNMPLGFIARDTYVECEIKLQSGDAVVLYSDGITEATDAQGHMFGEQRLLDVVQENGQLGCKAILDRIHHAVRRFSATENFGDDLTCIVIKIDEAEIEEELARATFHYEVEAAALTTLRSDLENFVRQNYSADALTDVLGDLLVGVNEASTNVVQHAFPQLQEAKLLRMKLRARPNQIRIELSHNGVAFSGISTSIAAPVGQTETGYGLYIMEQSMDSIHFTRSEDGWNHVRMTKDIAPQEASDHDA